MTTSIVLTYKQLRSIKSHIVNMIPGTEPNRPEIIEIEFNDHPDVESVFEGCLYDSGNENTVVGYLNLTPETVSDIFRILSRESDSFVFSAAPDQTSEWKYLTNYCNVAVSETVPGLILKQNAGGYVLSYGITEKTWTDAIRRIERQHRKVIQQWSMACVDAEVIWWNNSKVGLKFSAGFDVRFDRPGIFAVLTEDRNQVIHFPTKEEFFDYMGRTYLNEGQ